MPSPPGYNTSANGVRGMREMPARVIPSKPINGGGGQIGKTRNGAPATSNTPIGTRRPRKN